LRSPPVTVTSPAVAFTTTLPFLVPNPLTPPLPIWAKAAAPVTSTLAPVTDTLPVLSPLPPNPPLNPIWA